MPRSERRTRRPPGPRMGVSASDVDFNGAESMAERLRRIAEVAPHGEINTMQTSELLIGAGLTRSKSRYNVDSIVHRCIKQSPDFVWIRRGWWRYVGSKTREIVDDTTAVGDAELVSAPVEAEVTGCVDDPELVSAPVEPTVVAEPYVPPRTMQWLNGTVEYREATHLGDKLRAIAQHTVDMTVEPRETSLRLLQDGQSTARQRNLERVVRRMLRDDPDFSALPTEWYQYRPRRSWLSCPSDEAGHNTRCDMTDKPWESTFHEEPIYGNNGHIGIPAW